MSINKDGNIEIIAHKDDLIYDRKDRLVEHWVLERFLRQYENIRGVQVNKLINFFLNLSIITLGCSISTRGASNSCYST